VKPRRIIRPLFFLAAVCAAAVQCGKPGKSVPFEELRAAVSRLGWIERTDQYRSFTAREFYDFVDGGAAVYERAGMLRGIGVTVGSRGRLADIYFQDFGSPSRARAMVGIKKESSSDPKRIPRVKTAPALYDEAIGGCVAFWAKGRCYVEMALTGYQSPDGAVRDAALLTDSLSAVIGRKK
jgi:hypothetical protein